MCKNKTLPSLITKLKRAELKNTIVFFTRLISLIIKVCELIQLISTYLKYVENDFIHTRSFFL